MINGKLINIIIIIIIITAATPHNEEAHRFVVLPFILPGIFIKTSVSIYGPKGSRSAEACVVVAYTVY
jgi:hypothetical protein